MAFFQYSPWHDAAQYGQGLGEKLSEALLRLPAQREERQRERTEFPLKLELMRAQIQEALSQPELRKSMLENATKRIAVEEEYRKGQLENTGKRIEEEGTYHRGQLDNVSARNKIFQQGEDERERNDAARIDMGKERMGISDALAKNKLAMSLIEGDLKQTQIKKLEEPKVSKPETSTQTDAQLKRAMDAQKLIGSTLPGGGSNTDISVDAARYAADKQQQNPTNSLVNILLPLMQPKLQTNSPGMLDSLFGGQPNVVTNGARFQLPVSAQPAANAPAPITPHGMVRVKSKDGQTGQIPEAELQQALQEGYTLIQ